MTRDEYRDLKPFEAFVRELARKDLRDAVGHWIDDGLPGTHKFFREFLAYVLHMADTEEELHDWVTGCFADYLVEREADFKQVLIDTEPAWLLEWHEDALDGMEAEEKHQRYLAANFGPEV